MTDQLVSIIITAFNEELYIGQVIESYLCQSHQNIEIIVVNDGSTDKTATLLDLYANKYANVKVIHFETNKGKVQAQNAAFKIASGQYIAISGADDYGCYSRIKTQLEYLEQNQLTFVFSNLFIVDRDRCLLEYRPLFYSKPKSICRDIKDLIQGWSVPGGTIFFTRELAEKIYPIPVNLPYEDRWFSFMAGVHGKIGYIHEALGSYRQTNNNSHGVIKHSSFKKFKNKWISVKTREFIYEEEIKKYLIEFNLWNSELEKTYIYKKALLAAVLTTDLQKRIQLIFEFLKQKMFLHVFLAIAAPIIIIIKYIKLNGRALIAPLVRLLFE